MSLQDKSITELRTIAQGLGVAGILSKTSSQLISAIEAKKETIFEVKPPAPETIIIDSRLRDAPPAESVTEDMLLEVLLPFINRGLIVEFPDEYTWEMINGKRTDTGTMAQPLRNVVRCAERIMK